MTIDLILLATAITSGFVLFLRIGRKLALISSVDVHAVPEKKADALKDQLIEERFARSLQERLRRVERWLRPVAAFTKRIYQRLVGHLKSLEERYTLPAERRKTDDSSKAKITALLNEARTYVEDEQLPVAEQKCIEALSINERDSSAYRLLAEIYIQQKDLVHAREVYEFLLKMNAEDAAAHLGLGRIASETGEYLMAERELKQSIAVSDTASVHLDLAEVYEKLGDSKKALGAAQEALTLDPRNPKILDYFIGLAIASGERALAQDALARLEEVNPENQKLTEFAQQLESLAKKG